MALAWQKCALAFGEMRAARKIDCCCSEAVETETSHTGAITNRAELSKGQAVAMLSSATAQQRTTGAAALT